MHVIMIPVSQGGDMSRDVTDLAQSHAELELKKGKSFKTGVPNHQHLTPGYLRWN